DLGGHLGAGSINASGLYQAPAKGALPSGFTEVVVATSVDDPLRKAYAWVTLVGLGPPPVPTPTIDIWPKATYLYYPQNGANNDHRNDLIDDSNKMQIFRATVRDSPSLEVEWLVNNVVQVNPEPSSLFRYEVTGAGNTNVVVVTARIKTQPAVL